MKKRTVSEATNVLTGYVSTHPVEEAELMDNAAWINMARAELHARSLGVVKAFSNETLEAIVAGEIDMPKLYAAARVSQLS